MTLPRPVAAVVFDMDGLLFDTETLYGEAILAAARELGCAMSHDVFLQLVGRSRELNYAFLRERYGADYPLDDLVVAWGRHFRRLAEPGLPLKPGAAELLDRLDALGLPKALRHELRFPPAREGHGMIGSGMFVVNAPFGLAEEAARLDAVVAGLW